MFAQLGEYVFDALVSPESLSVTTSIKYADRPLIGQKDGIQRTGSAARPISFRIKLLSLFCVPEDELAALVDAAEGSDVLPFIFGNGRKIGDFVITEITEEYAQFDSVGNIIEVTLSISIKEHHDPDKLQSEIDGAADGALALSSNNPSLARYTPAPIAYEDALVSAAIVNAGAYAAEVDKNVKDYKENPNRVAYYSERITKAMSKVQEKMDDIAELTNPSAYLQSIAPDLVTSAQAVASTAQNIKNLMPITSVSDVQNANTTLQSSMGVLNRDAKDVFSFNVARIGG